MNRLSRFFVAGAALLGMSSVSGTASAFDLSNCDGSGLACPYVTYGVGNSYSLSLNAYMWADAKAWHTAQLLLVRPGLLLRLAYHAPVERRGRARGRPRASQAGRRIGLLGKA